MNDVEALQRFAINADGVVANRQPLQDHGYVYVPANRSWRRQAGRSSVKFARSVSRSFIERECNIPDEVIQAWENALRMGDCHASQDASAMFGVSADGQPVCLSPVGNLNLAYFPQSGVWRRTRADRSEVAREVVAKRAGVACEIIAAWEQAVRCGFRSDCGDTGKSESAVKPADPLKL